MENIKKYKPSEFFCEFLPSKVEDMRRQDEDFTMFMMYLKEDVGMYYDPLEVDLEGFSDLFELGMESMLVLNDDDSMTEKEVVEYLKDKGFDVTIDR